MTIEQFLNRYGTATSSNFDLIRWAKVLGIKSFYCLMRNELNQLKKLKKLKKVYIICNYQTTTESGTHWICMCRDGNKNYYFDSYGIEPFQEAIEFLGEGVNSTFKIQKEGQTFCGQMSLYVLYQLFKGKNFYDIVLYLYNI